MIVNGRKLTVVLGEKIIYKYMQRIFFVIVCIGLSIACYAQSFTIKGFVKDSKTGEALLFAHCYDSLSNKVTLTNTEGFYSLTLPKGKIILVASYIGYQSTIQEIILTKDTTIQIELTPSTTELHHVVVHSHTPLHQQVIMGKTTIPVQTLKALPSFAGEPDIMKAISFLPGVSLGKEGYSNIYVRGGDRGQNLILLDGIKLYNTNHIGGFISLINSDILKHVDIYKGGFPSRYGGRASSVIDIFTKDGNNKEFKGKFNIGLLNSGFIIEAPISENMSYFFATRSSYYDLYTISARRKYNQTGIGEYFGYTFFDINGKISWQISQDDKLTLSVFSGHDYQKTVEALDYSAQKKDAVDKLNIHNTGVSLVHSSLIKHKIYWKNIGAFSVYNNTISSDLKYLQYGSSVIESVSSFSEIKDINFQSRLELYPNNNAIKTGIEISKYSFMPGIQASYTENKNAQSIEDTIIGFSADLTSYEGSVYIEDEISINNSSKLNLGVRGTSYVCKDTVFFRVEPRISFRLLLSKRFSFKANYTILNQYNHVLIQNYGGFEKEIWLAATKELIPQKAKQTSAGFFYSNEFRKLDISIEGFYKQMSNLLEYRSPVYETDNLDNIENIAAKNGKGISYGAEFQTKKDFNKISIIVNYTLAWNYRQFDELNNAKWFPFIYDKRHDLSVVSLWQISDKYSFNSNFSLSSGMPSTLPVGYSKTDTYFYDYYIFGEINNRRLPLYHRLDLSLIKKEITKKGRIQQFTFNIFNVYARQNPVYLYYNNNTGKVYQKSIFSIVPTVSYSIQF